MAKKKKSTKTSSSKSTSTATKEEIEEVVEAKKPKAPVKEKKKDEGKFWLEPGYDFLRDNKWRDNEEARDYFLRFIA